MHEAWKELTKNGTTWKNVCLLFSNVMFTHHYFFIKVKDATIVKKAQASHNMLTRDRDTALWPFYVLLFDLEFKKLKEKNAEFLYGGKFFCIFTIIVIIIMTYFQAWRSMETTHGHQKH